MTGLKPASPHLVRRTRVQELQQCSRILGCRVTLPVAADSRGLGSLEPTSPRSVEACLRLGIEPASLRYRPPNAFQLSGQASDLADLAYRFNEAVRQARHLT